MSKRIEWIDLAKGWTIFFVVLFHSIGTINESHIFNGFYQSLSEWLYYLIGIFIMPLFFSLSGYLYRSLTDWEIFKKKTLKRLISYGVPYVLFSFLYVLMVNLAPGGAVHNNRTWGSLLLIWYQPVSFNWFLYALFFIELIIGMLEVMKIDFKYITGLAVILFIISQLVSLPSGVHYTFAWMIVFLLGQILRKYEFLYKHNKYAILFSVVLVLSTIIQLMTQDTKGWYWSNQITFANMIAKLTVIPVMYYIFSNLKRGMINNYFARYGAKSLIIYLVHALVVSVVRFVVIYIGISNYWLMLILVVALTWGISILACWLTDRVKLFNVLMYPAKYLKV